MNKKKKRIPELRFPEFSESWNIIPVSDMCDVYRGGAFSKADMDENGSKPCIHYGELFTKYNEVISTIYSKTNKSDGFKSKVGDILMPSSDVTPDGLAKASAIMLDDVLLGGDMNILRPKKSFNSIFLSYLLNHSKREIIKLVSGTTVKHIYASQIITCQLPIITSKQEQQKIASCLSSLDELIEAHNQKLDLLKDHKKGLMQNLFPQEGEKVPNLRFKEFEKDGAWILKEVDDFIDLFTGIALKGEEICDDESGRPILRGINITEGYIRHSKEIDKYYLGTLEKLKRYFVKENDIVIAMDGSKVGKNVALVGKSDENAILIQRVARIRTNKKADFSFIYQFFISDNFRTYVDSVNTSSGIPHISAQQIKNYKVWFPPNIKEQQKIASCLSALDKGITAQTERIEELKHHKKGLMQGLFPKMNDYK
ncbi:MAG: restriction endonuclease subunit S [Flavobacteriales bacterium]|nr:restriction endonuclease subunit S [Flavobacteriales bacterium]MCW8912919.1 restriction endonuclease subunit S [Flavobacteriales bacterium]MCW8938721.1 restriction endonuclease subunit S [Flavobacteriales bacterium]MCW8967938.1 restriction endonuclease subunit S [Flavobacteriales bacterium]MCW8988920.1 restriction endonuclease subunit S [Flavobacteriales bacterium]